MHNIIFVLILFLIHSCTDKTPSLKSKEPTQVLEQKKLETIILDQDLIQQLRFSGQVELAILKIIEPNFKNSTKIPSQLNILSQLLELNFNSKSKAKIQNNKIKTPDIFFDCFNIGLVSKADSEIEITPLCEKKSNPIATIKKLKNQKITIRFIQNEWKKIIGNSAVLNQPDKICLISISDKKVFDLVCENTLLTINQGASLEEIKLKKITFNREGKDQITVVGGRFKDFIERSQIKIVVPESGKILFQESEVLIKDEFL